MVRKPLTFFVFLASSGENFFKVAGQRQQSASLEGLSPRDRLDGSATRFLTDAAVVCVVPVTSVFRARILGQPVPAAETWTTLEIAQEACLAILLTLLSAWLLKRVLPSCKQVALPAAQPTKGACSADPSPKNGLATCSCFSVQTLLTRHWQLGQRCVQRRRLYMYKLMEKLEGILPSLLGSSPLSARLPRTSAPGSHGLQDFHEAAAAGFLMPVEVAACRSPPEVCAVVQRLLSDRWEELACSLPSLESVPEDACLVFEEDSQDDFSEQLVE